MMPTKNALIWIFLSKGWTLLGILWNKFITYESLLGNFESLLKDSNSVRSYGRQKDPLPKLLQGKITEHTIQLTLSLFNRIIWICYLLLIMPNHTHYYTRSEIQIFVPHKSSFTTALALFFTSCIHSNHNISIHLN